MGLFRQIRSAAEVVSQRARFVNIDPDRLVAFARELAGEVEKLPVLDPARHHRGTPESTLAFVVCLNAINFGSGWFPHLMKRPGCSGYFTVATCMKERFDDCGAWTASELRDLSALRVSGLLGQGAAGPEAAELMELFAQALRNLGELLETHYGGSFELLLKAAEGRAERLVEVLCEMPFYRDTSRYGETLVPFYKRAQLTSADLAAAFGGQGFGRFTDLDSLTIFADNLVPHVLRREGVLIYAESLAEEIDAGRLLTPGTAQEVEIRAVALHAVEQMARSLRSRVPEATPHRLDFALWNRGQAPAMKAHPRHRARSVYY